MSNGVTCPYCKSEAHCEYVDVGIGLQQVTPFICDRCGASGPFGTDRSLDQIPSIEHYTGWFLGDSVTISTELSEEYQTYLDTRRQEKLCRESGIDNLCLEHWLDSRE